MVSKEILGLSFCLESESSGQPVLAANGKHSPRRAPRGPVCLAPSGRLRGGDGVRWEEQGDPTPAGSAFPCGKWGQASREDGEKPLRHVWTA